MSGSFGHTLFWYKEGGRPDLLPELLAGCSALITHRCLRVAGPHVVGGTPQPFGMAIDKGGIEAAAVAEMDEPAREVPLIHHRLVVSLAVVAVVVIQGAP